MNEALIALAALLIGARVALLPQVAGPFKFRPRLTVTLRRLVPDDEMVRKIIAEWSRTDAATMAAVRADRRAVEKRTDLLRRIETHLREQRKDHPLVYRFQGVETANSTTTLEFTAADRRQLAAALRRDEARTGRPRRA